MSSRNKLLHKENAMSERLNVVTGACGFVGSHLVKLLLADNQKVIATDLPKAFSHPKNQMIFKSLGIDFSNPNCQVVPADLTDIKSIGKVFEQPVTHFFHTASLYDYSAPMEILKKVNIDGGINVFELASKKETIKRFIHWSTCGVFGKPHTAREGELCNIPFAEHEFSSSPRNTPIEEDAPRGTNLVNDYSVTKFKQEQIAWQYYREKGLPLIVVRPAPLYGAGSDYGHGGIVLTINKGLLPAIPSDTRNYITTSVHVEDMAGFALYIADKDFALGEDYNVVDDSIISYYDFIKYIALLLGRRIYDVPFLKQWMLRPVMQLTAGIWLQLELKYHVKRVRVLEIGSATYMSSSYWISNKKSKETGYKYRYPDVHEGLRDTIDWFRCVGWLDKKYNPQAIWQENMKK